jgi:transposase-like protein
MARRKHYNFYDDDFKATAVALTEIPGIQSNHVAEALDIHEVMLYRWRMEAELKRLRQLERDHALLQEEHALLKKAIRHSLQQKAKSSNS